jgi:hypothetical protein
VANSIDKVKAVIEAIIGSREYFNLAATESVLQMLNRLLEAKKNQDYILLADLLELQLISFLTGVQELIISREEILFDEDNYQENIQLLRAQGVGFSEELLNAIPTEKLLESGYLIEFTSCGRMTLAAENEGVSFYFHTNNNVHEEAFLLARRWYRNNIKRYVLYGFGLGYHVGELHALAKEAVIEVYETDLNVIQLACAFTDLKELIGDDQVRLVYDPGLAGLKERITELTPEEAFYIHYPSYMNLRSRNEKEILENIQPWLKAAQAY